MRSAGLHLHRFTIRSIRQHVNRDRGSSQRNNNTDTLLIYSIQYSTGVHARLIDVLENPRLFTRDFDTIVDLDFREFCKVLPDPATDTWINIATKTTTTTAVRTRDTRLPRYCVRSAMRWAVPACGVRTRACGEVKVHSSQCLSSTLCLKPPKRCFTFCVVWDPVPDAGVPERLKTCVSRPRTTM